MVLYVCVITKIAELSYKLGYLITAALFCPVRPVSHVCTDSQGLYVPDNVYLHWPHYELPRS